MVAYESFKVKEKSSWVIRKVATVAYGSGRLRELFITKFESQIKRGWLLRERSQGQLRLYIIFPVCKLLTRDQVFV